MSNTIEKQCISIISFAYKYNTITKHSIMFYEFFEIKRARFIFSLLLIDYII